MYSNRKHSAVFKKCMIMVEVIYFIVAIIIGFVSRENTVFNWWIALIIWISNAPLLAILYSIYSVLDNQEKQIDISCKIFEQLQVSKINNPVENKETKNKSTQVTNMPYASNSWICPQCGDKNNQSSVQCACGYFKSKTTIPQKSFVHTCSNCKKTFTVKYTPNTNNRKKPILSVICPHCKNKEIIK